VKKNTILTLTAISLAVGFVFVASDLTSTHISAQKADDPKMPEVVILGKDAKLGQITFNHIKHNGGTYSITPGNPIACISCHHTARPAAEIAKFPPLKTSWPADRTTILTAEVFAKDPKAAGVAACRDCHARTGEKPKLLDAIPEIKHEGSTAIMTMTNMNAFHRTCAGCHAEVRKTIPLSKGPIQMQCTMCHKKTV
jgi:cytochrome c553